MTTLNDFSETTNNNSIIIVLFFGFFLKRIMCKFMDYIYIYIFFTNLMQCNHKLYDAIQVHVVCSVNRSQSG